MDGHGTGWTGGKKGIVGKHIPPEEKDALLSPQYSEGQGITLRRGTKVRAGEYSNVPQMENMGNVEGPTAGERIPDHLGYAGLHDDMETTAKRKPAKLAGHVGKDAT